METKDSFISCPVCKTTHVAPVTTRRDGTFASTCVNCGHFFKFKSVAPFKSSVTFTVNGKSVTVGNEYSSSTSLADYLRQSRVSMGTKVFCKQGGCGVCIVVAKMTLNSNDPPVTANINSCLCPVFVCDGWEITTVEGIGSTRSTLNTIQNTVASYGGTQCGYCTPGHVMNMYGLMKKYPHMTKKDAEDYFEGNLCRCTGYRPILDAMKSLLPDSNPDIEDLSSKLCKTTGKRCGSSGGSCAGQCSNHGDQRAVKLVFNDTQWNKPTTMAELYQMLAQSSGQKVRLLGANTGTGYFWQENIRNFDVVIDISSIPDMYVNTKDAQSGQFTIGGGLPLSDLMDLFKAEAAKPTDNGNFDQLVKYLYRVASSPIRNRGTWAGNLMLKNKYPSFPSDVFNIMTVLGASLSIGQTPHDVVSCEAFKTTDMTGKCLSKATFQGFGPNDVVACFKVMPRSQNSLALVNGAFRCAVNKVQGYMVTSKPIISIGGISDTFHRATATEQYLFGKQLSSPATISGALTTLENELVPTEVVGLPSGAYRKTVACALLYKFFLHVLGDTVTFQYRSGYDVLHDTRPLSSGVQTYDTNKQEWPLNEPLKKIEANIQTTGEAQYTDDLPALPGQLYAKFVTSTQANATVQTIDTADALTVPGVVRVLTASDIPTGAVNDVKPPVTLTFDPTSPPEELFCSGKVEFYGQSLALVVAESKEAAEEGARRVKVTYNSIQTPILTVDQAVAAKSLYPNPIPPYVKGNPDQAINSAAHQISGSFHTQEQVHFHMETQATNCVPTEDGVDIISTTQWSNSVQVAAARVTGLSDNKINVSCKRLGGAYGGKITKNNIVGAACALAARLTNRPVRMRMSIQDNLDMCGRRFPHRFDYKVGFDNTGRVQGIDMHVYTSLGYIPNENVTFAFKGAMDCVYNVENWRLIADGARLNTAVTTFCRAPVTTPAAQCMEHIMEKIAATVGSDPVAVRRLNFYQEGQETMADIILDHCNLQAVADELMTSAQVETRKTLFTFFNKDNRWKKKALAVVPAMFGCSYAYSLYSTTVAVYGEDGSVMVNHGGTECGQGINTKVCQIVAYKLGVPVDTITVKSCNTTINPNNQSTGGSVTSEECCKGAAQCCDQILANMKPIKDKMTNPTWKELVKRCFQSNVVLQGNYTVAGVPEVLGGKAFDYYTFGATCAEVELDVLTGEYQINRVDIVYDCGESLNPAVDIGQVEGSFIMGIGLNTTEEVVYDPTNGKMINNDTWGYHAPTNKDIPVDFRISLLKNAPNPHGFLRSKASGEPPLNMSCAVFYALQNCIKEARKDAGQTGDFTFEPPATRNKVQELCSVQPSQFVI